MKTFNGDALAIERGIIVHGCNCIGVMGAGIAGQVKKKFPEVFKQYQQRHIQSGLTLGTIIPVAVSTSFDKWIVNAMTQQSTGGVKPVSYDAIHDCFVKVVELQRKIKEGHGHDLPICFPMIGAGLGGGSWAVISTIINEVVPDDIETQLYIL
jgi:O-acetyl-ADP-ribose deacetylase (regulator of RNase III)